MTDLAIEAAGLTKSFGDTKALAGVDLAARKGTVLGPLGPNSAGKPVTGLRHSYDWVPVAALGWRPARRARPMGGEADSGTGGA
jgi:hypothetical protein